MENISINTESNYLYKSTDGMIILSPTGRYFMDNAPTNFADPFADSEREEKRFEFEIIKPSTGGPDQLGEILWLFESEVKEIFEF